jgi:hypothetical protein
VRNLLSALITLTGACIAGPAAAHHSVDAEYNRMQAEQIVAVLTRLDIANPHVWFRFREALPGGKTREWAVQSASPTAFRRQLQGSVGAFVIGDTYTISISPHRHDAANGWLNWAIFSDGRYFSCC